MGNRWPALVVLLVLAVAACSGESASDDGRDATSTSAAESTQQASDGAPIQAVVDGGAETLEFSWEPVPDADSYGVLVFDANDEVVWIWTGRGTMVSFGTFPELDDDELDPEIVERFGPLGDLSPPVFRGDLPVPAGGSYVIVAFDAAGEIVSTSRFELPS